MAQAVAPEGLVAVTVMTLVPPLSATGTLNAPLASAVVWAVFVEKSPSVFVAATTIVLPGADVPETVTVGSVTGD